MELTVTTKSKSNLPPLTAIQARKLKQLTIVSLSSESKIISYSVLQQQLEISELRELEDLIIDAIYQGIVQGSLDQRKQQLEIESAMGRDLQPDALESMISTLTNWANQSDNLLKTIKEKISHANIMSDNEKKHKEDFEKRVEAVRLTLKATMEAEMQHAADLDSGEFFDERTRKGGRSKIKGGHREHPHHPQQRDRRGV